MEPCRMTTVTVCPTGHANRGDDLQGNYNINDVALSGKLIPCMEKLLAGHSRIGGITFLYL